MPRLWTEEETRALARAWAEEAAVSREHPRTPAAFNDALHLSFLRIARVSAEHRPLKAVLAKRYCLRSLFEYIYELNKSQEDCGEPSWFELPLERRQQVRATWNPTRVKGDISWEVYNELLPVLAPEATITGSARSASRSVHAATSGSTPEAVSSFEQWEYPELMILARASAETRRAHPSGTSGFAESSKTPLFAKYREYGGSRRRTKKAIANQARYLLEAYRFISAFNKRARRAGEQSWFHRSADERFAHERQFGGTLRVLRHMDKKMFVVMKGSRASRSPSRRRRIKREDTEIHQVTERRHYRVSSGQAVVSVNEKRQIRSGRFIDSTATATLATRRDAPSEPPHDVARLLRRHLREHNHISNEEGDEDDEVVITKIRPATRQTRAVVAAQASQNDYTSALEHAVTTMSTQLAELDRRLTEARINENERMLVRVLRACRQSSGSVPTALVQEMLKRAGSNMLQVVDLANQQQEQDDELMQRLMSALTNGDGDSS